MSYSSERVCPRCGGVEIVEVDPDDRNRLGRVAVTTYYLHERGCRGMPYQMPQRALQTEVWS